MTTHSPWLLLWSLMIFASVVWYAVLLFIVGWKGGKEILQLTRRLSAPKQSPDNASAGSAEVSTRGRRPDSLP